MFAHSRGFMGKAIRFGEWLRRPRLTGAASVLAGPGYRWNHVCFIDRIENEVAYVIQAEDHGITNTQTLESVGEYRLVTPPDHVDLDSMMWFARQQLGDEYGWGTIIAIAIDIVTPGWFPSFRPANKRSNSWICSAITAESLRWGGWYHQWPDIYLVTPAQLFLALEV